MRNKSNTVGIIITSFWVVRFVSILVSNTIFYIKYFNYRSAVRDMRAVNRGCLFSDERDVPGSEVSTTYCTRTIKTVQLDI